MFWKRERNVFDRYFVEKVMMEREGWMIVVVESNIKSTNEEKI